MAVAIPGFDAQEFRDGVHLAMRMGMPVEEDRQPEFVKRGTVVSTPEVDSEGVPWDPTATAVRTPDVAHRVLCALEMRSEADSQERWLLEPGSIKVTLLDEEYELVKGFDYMNLWPAGSGEPVRYNYVKVLEQVSLDVVGVWTLECRTEDQV